MRLPGGVEILVARLAGLVPALDADEWTADPSWIAGMQNILNGPPLEKFLETSGPLRGPDLIGAVPRSDNYEAFRLCVSNGHLE